MKKVVATLGILAVAVSAFAQGTITVANNSATLVRQWTSLSDPTLITVPASGGKVELLWAPVGTTDINLFQQIGTHTPINIFPSAGRFQGTSVVTVPGGPGGIAPGALVNVVLRGWTGAFLTYDEAFANGTGMAGYSSVFTVDTGDPTTTPAGIPGTILAGGFSGMTLVPIPEPSTFALAGLGAAALLIFRRRK